MWCQPVMQELPSGEPHIPIPACGDLQCSPMHFPFPKTKSHSHTHTYLWSHCKAGFTKPGIIFPAYSRHICGTQQSRSSWKQEVCFPTKSSNNIHLHSQSCSACCHLRTDSSAVAVYFRKEPNLSFHGAGPRWFNALPTFKLMRRTVYFSRSNCLNKKLYCVSH